MSETLLIQTTHISSSFLLLKNSVKKYHLRLSKDGKEYDEDIEIDIENETETFHVPKTSPNEESADMVYDFKKVINIFSRTFIMNHNVKITPAFRNGDKNSTSFPALFYSRRDPGNEVDKYLAARQLRGLFVAAKRAFTSLQRIWLFK